MIKKYHFGLAFALGGMFFVFGDRNVVSRLAEIFHLSQGDRIDHPVTASRGAPDSTRLRGLASKPLARKFQVVAGTSNSNTQMIPPVQGQPQTNEAPVRDNARRHWEKLASIQALSEERFEIQGQLMKARFVEVENANLPFLVTYEPLSNSILQSPIPFGASHRVVVAGQYIAKLESSKYVSVVDRELRSRGGQIAGELTGGQYYRFNLPVSTVEEHRANLQILETLPHVESIAEDRYVYASLLGNDPYLSVQWGLKNLGTDPFAIGDTYKLGEDIGAEGAWTASTNCSAIVAILDTGADVDHPDLKPNLLLAEGRNFVISPATDKFDDDNGHGTHVAGIVGAVGNDKRGVSGVCWNAKIIPIKVLDQDGGGIISNVVLGINYAVSTKAQIINMSLGAPGVEPSVNAALDLAFAAGKIVVVAAGNDGTNNDVMSVTPASYSNPLLVSVGAFQADGLLAPFSNFGGTTVGIAAPGVNILSTWPLNILSNTGIAGYQVESGTSMAAPFIAGALSLFWSYVPQWTPTQIVDFLKAKGVKHVFGGKIKGDIGLKLAPMLDGVRPKGEAKVLSQVTNKLWNSSDSISIKGGFVAQISPLQSKAKIKSAGAVVAEIEIANLADFESNFALTLLKPGAHEIVLELIDDVGRIYTFPLGTVQVNNPPKLAIELSPGQKVVENQKISILSRAEDSDGSIASVEFFVDGKSFATLAQAPYSLDWTPKKTGEIEITVKATDDQGGVATSEPVKIQVGERILAYGRTEANYSGNVECELALIEPDGSLLEVVSRVSLKSQIYCQKYCVVLGPTIQRPDNIVQCGTESKLFYLTPR